MGLSPIRVSLNLQQSKTLPVGQSSELLIDEEGVVGHAELQGTQLALRNRAQDASKQLLLLMHEARDYLRFWEETLQSPADLPRVLVLQTGARRFFRFVLPPKACLS